MTSVMQQLQRGTDRLAMIIGKIVIHTALVVAVAVVAVAMGQALGMSDYMSTPAPAPTTTAAPSAGTPVQAPAPTACELPPAGGLFHPCATLDMGTIDDLREDREGHCIALGGVLTPQRTCVDSVPLWQDEVSPTMWTALRDAGFPRDIDASSPGNRALRVPAEWVILGGEDGEKVLAVDMARPLTPQLY